MLAEGIGSVYLSTFVVFLNFLLVFLLSRGKLIAQKNALFAALLFFFFVLTTTLNGFLDKGAMIKEQLVFSIIHLQLILAFILGTYYINFLTKTFFYKITLICIVCLSARIFIDDLDKVFNLSSVRGLRVETLFAGGANNFALITGIGFIISFFYLKKGFLKTVLCVYLLAIVILTMSRGALFGLIFTLFTVAIYDPKGKTLSLLLKTSLFLTIIGTVFLLYSDAAQSFAEQFSQRFLSLFSGETTIEKASSGRGLIIRDLYYNHLKESSIFEILFGHGMGSINFMVSGSPYESSHNIIVDICYRNGLLAIIMFIIMFVIIFINFLKDRKKTDLTLFGIFIFLHFEIFVNPFVYAAQTGWIYGLFLAIILNRHKLRSNKPINNIRT